MNGISKKFMVLVLFFEAMEDVDPNNRFIAGLIFGGFVVYLILQGWLDRKKDA